MTVQLGDLALEGGAAQHLLFLLFLLNTPQLSGDIGFGGVRFDLSLEFLKVVGQLHGNGLSREVCSHQKHPVFCPVFMVQPSLKDIRAQLRVTMSIP